RIEQPVEVAEVAHLLEAGTLHPPAQRVGVAPPGLVFEEGEEQVMRVLARRLRCRTAGGEGVQHPPQLELAQPGLDGGERRHAGTSATYPANVAGPRRKAPATGALGGSAGGSSCWTAWANRPRTVRRRPSPLCSARTQACSTRSVACCGTKRRMAW